MKLGMPKPLHGWRVLAGEVGVIVLGVLIGSWCLEALRWDFSPHQTVLPVFRAQWLVFGQAGAKDDLAAGLEAGGFVGGKRRVEQQAALVTLHHTMVPKMSAGLTLSQICWPR